MFMQEVYHINVRKTIKRFVQRALSRKIYKLTIQQKVNHAGYQRYILERNPRRFNSLGDELEDSESDADADVDAEEENPYGNVKLEGMFHAQALEADLTYTLQNSYDP